MKKTLYRTFFSLILISCGSSSHAIGCSEPKVFVESVVDEIMPVLGNRVLNQEQKLSNFTNIFDEHIDFPWMAKYILSQQWPSLTAEQQQNFIKTYREYIISSYINKLNDYKGTEKVVIKNISFVKDHESYMVDATIINAPGDEDDFSIMLRKSDSCFTIDDLIGDGVSILKTEKQDFDSVVNQKGFGELINVLKQKIEQNHVH